MSLVSTLKKTLKVPYRMRNSEIKLNTKIRVATKLGCPAIIRIIIIDYNILYNNNAKFNRIKWLSLCSSI